MKSIQLVSIILALLVFLGYNCSNDIYKNKTLVRENCMSCHDLAYEGEAPSLLSMCEQNEVQTYTLLVKALNKQSATDPHRKIRLSKAQINRIAAYVCDPYAPAQ